MKLTDLKPANYNPRKATDEQLERLKKSLKEFGDLSGIVFNRRTGNLVGGHQRLKCLPSDAKIEKKDLKQKTKTGTVAQGFIILDGEKYTYREVDWDEATEKMANIAANKHGGEWDDDKLGELLKELSEISDFDIDLTGFEMDEIDNIINTGSLNPGVMRSSFKGGYGGGKEAVSFSEDSNPNQKYPVTVILNQQEWEQWEAAKQKAKLPNDKQMILSFIGGKKC